MAPAPAPAPSELARPEVERPELAWQTSLFAGAESLGFDADLAGVRRRELSSGAWVDHAPDWLAGADTLFPRVIELAPWGAYTMEMYGERVLAPRLTARWHVDDLPPELAVLRDVGRALSDRYGKELERIGINLYRDGRDSVAWHGDRIARELPSATIAILSLGHRRPLRLRPRGGGPSLGFELGRGDLFVMGGSCQRTWQHTVPKIARALPRISVTFRHRYPGREDD
ncbi:MAG: alpha-ketoglutarate-dependent dioxygenase AlkB [Actinobacteria bacterium]|nr:alpha-ketoglutarate-dependent dioxygenase AlkB [Actinomycetota bacterium]